MMDTLNNKMAIAGAALALISVMLEPFTILTLGKPFYNLQPINSVLYFILCPSLWLAFYYKKHEVLSIALLLGIHAHALMSIFFDDAFAEHRKLADFGLYVPVALLALLALLLYFLPKKEPVQEGPKTGFFNKNSNSTNFFLVLIIAFFVLFIRDEVRGLISKNLKGLYEIRTGQNLYISNDKNPWL